MLDVGTGSGILAIYGALLGASGTVAVDIDPEAVRWAEKNIKLNKLRDRIDLSSMPIEKCNDRFSLVAANLALLDCFSLARTDPFLNGYYSLYRGLENGLFGAGERLGDSQRGAGCL